jgi:hypothetical protein
MTDATLTSARNSSTDDALIAEIPAAMLEKLREDSRKDLKSSSFAIMFCGMLLATGKHTDLFGSYANLAFMLLGVVLIVLGLSRFIKARRPSDELVQVELKYRHEHGKWRWER